MKVNSSRPQRRPECGHTSTDNPQQTFSAISQVSLFPSPNPALPGAMNDGLLVRSLLAESIRKSGKSRETIADDMSRLTGTPVTVRRLNAFTAESREDYHWPAELDRAFCVATGCWDLLRVRVEHAGFRMITEIEWELLELGREYLRQKRANDRVALLEKHLQGVEL